MFNRIVCVISDIERYDYFAFFENRVSNLRFGPLPAAVVVAAVVVAVVVVGPVRNGSRGETRLLRFDLTLKPEVRDTRSFYVYLLGEKH